VISAAVRHISCRDNQGAEWPTSLAAG
jgi:hypothetical protein